VAVVPRSSTMARSTLSAADEDLIAANARLPDRYMYYPAMTFPHKNHLRLFDAMALLRDRKGVRLNLICTGRTYKPFHPTVLDAVKKLGLDSQVRFLGTVPDGLLAVCYKRAEFIVFPSLLEGHSQSLLEALYHGKAIVAARQSSVPETVGAAGYLFDALDVESIAAALEKAWMHKTLRSQLAANTEGSFDRYRWDRALLTLTACYKSAAGMTLSSQERAALDRALLEDKPEDA
jgi:glycosyltransferase involved in cell wall biosynthesis